MIREILTPPSHRCSFPTHCYERSNSQARENPSLSMGALRWRRGKYRTRGCNFNATAVSADSQRVSLPRPFPKYLKFIKCDKFCASRVQGITDLGGNSPPPPPDASIPDHQGFTETRELAFPEAETRGAVDRPEAIRHCPWRSILEGVGPA